jgi:hypothetical protein
MNDSNHLEFAFSNSATLLLIEACSRAKHQSHSMVVNKTEKKRNCSVDFDLRRNRAVATITGNKDCQFRIESMETEEANESARVVGAKSTDVLHRRLQWRNIAKLSSLSVTSDAIRHVNPEWTAAGLVVSPILNPKRVDPQGFIPWIPTVRVTTTNARFTAALKKVRNKGTFCIAANKNAISIFSSGDQEPVRSFAASKHHDTLSVAGVPYSIIHNTLYSRKNKALGLITRLGELGLSFDLTEYGIIKDRIYVKISMGMASATLLFEGITPSKIDIPDLPSSARQRRGATTNRMDAPIEEKEWTSQEQERIHLWRLAHQEECDVKNRPYSDSIQRWFSDYTMVLIRRGDSPSELDLDIMSRV